MKIKPGHFDALKASIETVIEQNGGKERIVKAYESGDFSRADKVKDLQKRLCFDLLYTAQVKGLLDEIYLYANDSHIFTALKSICPKVTKAY